MAKRRTRTRRQVPDAAEAPDVQPEEAEEPAPEEVQAEEPAAEDAPEEAEPKKETTRKREPRGEPVTDEPVEVAGGELVQAMLEGLAEGGKPVLFTKGKGGAFIVSHVEAAPAKPTSKKGYKEEDFWSPEYAEFRGWWSPMTAEEKEAYAKENKVTWDVHDNDLVNNIRLSEAVQKHLGISKYQPGFEERTARIAGVPAAS